MYQVSEGYIISQLHTSPGWASLLPNLSTNYESYYGRTNLNASVQFRTVPYFGGSCTVRMDHVIRT
jgi:hypothetical protein